MGIHLGPLATSPNQATLPSEVIVVLGKVALESATAYVHIRSGIDSLLGDTHLVVIGGKLHVVARKSSLDPLEDVPLLALPEIDEEGYRSVLQLRTAVGDKRVEIGATEANAVHALVAALSPDELDAPLPAAGAPIAEAPTAEAASAGEGAVAPTVALADDIDEARAAFLGLLATRRRHRKAKLQADRQAHERGERRRDRPAASRPKAARAMILHADVGTPSTDEDGDGVPDPPGERLAPAKRPEAPAQSSYLPLAVLGLLLMVGLLAVVSRLLADAR